MVYEAEEPPKLGLARIIDQRLRALEETVAVLKANHASEQTATVLAAQALDRRLEAMNELRDQINRERGSYVAVPVFAAEMRAHEKTDQTFHDDTTRRLQEIDGDLTEAKTLLRVLREEQAKHDQRVLAIKAKQDEQGGKLWAIGLLSLALSVIVFLFSWYASRPVGKVGTWPFQ